MCTCHSFEKEPDASEESGTDFSWNNLEQADEKQVERERTIEILGQAIETWTQSHLPEGQECSQRDLKALLQMLATEHKTEIDLLSSQMKDTTLFPDTRPSISLFKGDQHLPRVMMYGWKKSARLFTSGGAHDHGRTIGAVYVHEGAIREHVYGIDRTEWEEKIRGGANYAFIPIKNFGAKTLATSQSKTFRAPYIHDVEADASFDFSSTVNAYAGPKDPSAKFRVEGNELVLTV